MYEIDMAFIFNSILNIKDIDESSMKKWLSYLPSGVNNNMKVACIFDDVRNIDLRNSNEDAKIETFINSFVDSVFRYTESTFTDNEKSFIRDVFRFYLNGDILREDVDTSARMESIIGNKMDSSDECVEYLDFVFRYDLLKVYNSKPALYNKKSIALASELSGRVSRQEEFISQISVREVSK